MHKWKCGNAAFSRPRALSSDNAAPLKAKVSEQTVRRGSYIRQIFVGTPRVSRVPLCGRMNGGRVCV